MATTTITTAATSYSTAGIEISDSGISKEGVQNFGTIAQCLVGDSSTISSLSVLDIGTVKKVEVLLSAAELKAIGTAIKVVDKPTDTTKGYRVILPGIAKYDYDTGAFTTTGMSDIEIGIGSSLTNVLAAVDGPTAIGGSADKFTQISVATAKTIVITNDDLYVKASANAGGATAVGTLKLVFYVEEVSLSV